MSYVIDGVRTPRGRGKAGKGALSGIHPQELFAQVLVALARRNGFDPARVDDVIAGCVSQAGEQGANLARNAVLTAGWPIEVSATTLNRFCGSGLQAVHFAAMGAASGTLDLVAAGGVESMSRVPMGSDGGGEDGHNAHLRERFFQVPQGISADLIATLEGFSREEVDEIALRSQQRAARAVEERRFAKSLIAITDPLTGKLALDRDEMPRPGTTREDLLALEPAFVGLGSKPAGRNGETLDQIAAVAYPAAKQVRHLHTAGNSSGIADGAGAVLIASERYVRETGARPRARIRATATLGSEPVLMLTAPRQEVGRLSYIWETKLIRRKHEIHRQKLQRTIQSDVAHHIPRKPSLRSHAWILQPSDRPVTQCLTFAFAPRSRAKIKSADGKSSFIALTRLSGSLAFLSSSSNTSKYLSVKSKAVVASRGAPTLLCPGMTTKGLSSLIFLSVLDQFFLAFLSVSAV